VLYSGLYLPAGARKEPCRCTKEPCPPADPRSFDLVSLDLVTNKLARAWRSLAAPPRGRAQRPPGYPMRTHISRAAEPYSCFGRGLPPSPFPSSPPPCTPPPSHDGESLMDSTKICLPVATPPSVMTSPTWSSLNTSAWNPSSLTAVPEEEESCMSHFTLALSK